MLNQPRAVRKAPDFLETFLAIADSLIASDAPQSYKNSALLAKFKVLHEAGTDGNAAAQAKLLELADAERDSKSAKVVSFVRLVDMEKKLIDARAADAAALPKALEELQAYLTGGDEISNRHLRLSQLATELAERLPETDRDAWFKKLGSEFAKSVDLDLAFVGQRFGKPPVPQSAIVGKPFNLAGKLTSGEDLKWQNYRDKITVVDFWATWCTLCMIEHDKLKQVHSQFAGRGLEVVGVSIDTDKEELTKYLREHQIPWITLYGKEPQEVATKYGVRGVPTLFLIDAEGKVLMRANTVAELEPQIKLEIEALEKKAKSKAKK
jgi:thiol-disulfide isomerase/thioredoxin